MKLKFDHIFTGALLALVPMAPSFAQDADIAAERRNEPADVIVVTAQKRESLLSEVPMAIEAFSGVELEQRAIETVQDLAFSVPGMTTREDGPGSYMIFLRGLTNMFGNGALVGLYLDEAPLSLNAVNQLDLRPIDLERVEVLKGPQGTLYGEGSVAGAVRYITHAPVLNEFEGNVGVDLFSVADGDMGQTYTGVMNVPLVEDRLALRVATQIEQDGGWIDQPEAGIEDGNGSDLYHTRVSLLWNASDRLQVEAMGVFHRAETQLGLGYEEPDRTVDVAVDRSRVLIPKDLRYNLYNLEIAYDFDGAELIAATSYIDYDHDYPFSYIGGPETLYQGGLEGTDARYLNGEQLTQEVRLTSSGDGPFQWTFGGFYRDYEADLVAYYDTLYFGSYFPDLFFEESGSSESYAVFADASYDLTARFTLGAGVRYFEEDQTYFDGAGTDSQSFDSVDPRVYVSYAATDTINLYANVSSGSRSGGFNAHGEPGYDPESVMNYEVGAKGTVAGGALDFEVAAFYTEYDDMVRRGLVLVDSTLQQLSSNIGAVEIQGLEAGATWRATDALTFSGTLSLLDSEITEIRATDSVNIPGDPTDYTPEISYSLSGHYAFDWSETVPGYVRVDYSYRDAVPYVDRSSFPDENLPQYSDELSLVNLRVGAEVGDFDLEAYVLNATDENKAIDPYTAWSNANRTRPRTIGVSLRYTY